jgi:DNA adenine methylase
MLDPTRPVLRWYGGKWRIAPWIISTFPAHSTYVEPFGGAASVLLRKPRAYAEVYNDLDDWVVNLFRVLRDRVQAARLIAQLELTPFSRREFETTAELANVPDKDPVETARLLIVRSFMGFGANAHNGRSTGFRSNTHHGRAGDFYGGGARSSKRNCKGLAHDWANYPVALRAVIERMRGVTIEHREACEVMLQHDSKGTLHYVDPPYLPETRSPANKYDLKYRSYRHELSEEDHRNLLTRLHDLQGMVVLSGYRSAMYDEALRDWRRDERKTFADGARPRLEALWINPACAEALPQQSLFASEG